MTSKDADCSTGGCPVDGNKQQSKLVKSSDLPLVGNPYPPKDVIESDNPGTLELQIRSIRTTLQPFMAPFCKAYTKTSDVLAIGAAHTSSTIQSLGQNQSVVTNAVIIAGSSLLGITLARRRGIFKKILYGSVFFGGAMAACYPKEAKEKAEFAWFVTKKELPTLFAQQYEKISGKTTSETTQPKESKN